MTYIPLPQKEEGGNKRVQSSDERTRELLEQILVVLKKIEYHLNLATDTELKDNDV